MTKKRRRRTADEAREEILAAAEKRLAEAGPDGIRLQEIAADIGMSHPLLLHHFGSREGLVRAVVDRALMKLQGDLVGAFSFDAPPNGAALFERVAATFAEKGHARLLAWLVLSGYDDIVETKESHDNWKTIIDATHAFRLHGPKATKKSAPPEYDDTRFFVLLSALALFGQAIIGKVAFRQAGLGRDKTADKRFRNWLADVIDAQL